MAEGELTLKQQRFIEEFLIDLNATQAAIRAGYSKHTAQMIGSENLSKPMIKSEVDRLIAERTAKNKLTQQLVIDHIHGQITADTNELIELRRVCCRFCYGDGHLYQYTPAEQHERRLDHERLMGPEKGLEGFDLQGGEGYDRRKDPHPDCPECFGEGIEVPFAKDTRKLSAAARSLYAGIKVTDRGLEIKMHSKEAAIKLAAQHLGMISESRNLNVNVSLEVLVAASMKADPADEAKTIEHEEKK